MINHPIAASLSAGWLLVPVMALLWQMQRRTLNAGVVDVGWAWGVGALALLYAAMGDGWAPRRQLVAALFLGWSLRLGWYLLRDRVMHKPEEGRYLALRRQWHPHADRRFFWFFQMQAVAAVFFAIPALLAAQNRDGALEASEVAGVVLWVIGF